MKKRGFAWGVIKNTCLDDRYRERDLRQEWGDCESVGDFLQSMLCTDPFALVGVVCSADHLDAIEVVEAGFKCVSRIIGERGGKKLQRALVEAQTVAGEMKREGSWDLKPGRLSALHGTPLFWMVQSWVFAHALGEHSVMRSVFDSLARLIGETNVRDSGSDVEVCFGKLIDKALADPNAPSECAKARGES